MVLNYLPFFINTKHNMNKDRLIELLDIHYNEYLSNKELQNELTEYYKFIYGDAACASCKNKFKKHYDKLMVGGVAKMIEIENIQPAILFKLRSDIKVNKITFGDNLFFTSSYAPDDVVIEFLKINPNRISLFEVYPENWVELLQENNDEENDYE